MSNLLDEAKITEFDYCFLLDQHVLRFNVSMEESMTVDII